MYSIFFAYQLYKYPQKKALNTFVNGDWKEISIQEIISVTDAIASWFMVSGYKKGDKIAIVPEIGRPEWMFIDFACQKIGIVVVCIHPTFSLEEIKHALMETEAQLCITANEGLSYKIQSADINHEISFQHIDPRAAGYFDPLKLTSVEHHQQEELDKLKSTISTGDILSILYTSGTSGVPKGVVLTHKNVVSNILSTIAVFPLETSTRVLSFLPFSHVFRTYCLLFLFNLWCFHLLQPQ